MKKSKLIIISFTEIGSEKNAVLCERLGELGYSCAGYCVSRFAEKFGLQVLGDNIKEWIASEWGKSNFLFIGATGIAIRYVAPMIVDKYTDSAVLVMDEKAQFVIPLLSGHIGGAVAIGEVVAKIYGSTLVLTTASDVQKKFAVDVFAKRNGLKITDRVGAKEVTAAILEGKTVGFYSQYQIKGEIPSELTVCETVAELKACEIGIAITEEEISVPGILWLCPRNITVGIGCKRATAGERILEGLQRLLKQHEIHPYQLEALVSIDLKKEETGLIQVAEYFEIPFYTFGAEALNTVADVSATSAFVKETTGVGNVCESAAKYYCQDGKLRQAKVAGDGMTFALVEREIKVVFK